jgi:hypothetical protein
MRRSLLFILGVSCVLSFLSFPADAWFDETHVAISKVAGYSKWFNAVGLDMIKEKMGNWEGHNHFVNNPRETIITPEMVLGQAEKYNKIDSHGHLYGAIIASVRDYLKKKGSGKYSEYHLAFCAHYVADASMRPVFQYQEEERVPVFGVLQRASTGTSSRIAEASQAI